MDIVIAMGSLFTIKPAAAASGATQPALPARSFPGILETAAS